MPDKNEFEASEYLGAQRRKLFAAVTTLDRWMEDGMADGVSIRQVTVQPPGQTGSDYRAIIKGVDEAGRKWVTFVNANSLVELHAAIANVGEQRGFKWMEDKPFPKA